MSDSSFWKERQAAFLTYADRFKYLTAIGGGRSNSYELWWRDYPDVPSDVESVFHALAGLATAGLPEPDRIGEGQPWEIWLEFMRKNKFSHDLERDREYAGRRPGEIENPFQVSADFCEVLSARAVKSDAVRPANSSGATGSWPMPDKGAIARAQFWEDRQAEFAKYSKENSDVKAHWRGVFGMWSLWQGSAPRGQNTHQECESVLGAIARKAVTELPDSGVTGDAEPWRRWLDFMRERSFGYRVTGHTLCTELEWDAGVKDGKALHAVRREQRYTTGDEWTKVYRRTESGELQPLSEEELNGTRSEELQKYYHRIEDGVIEHVFESSAGLCQDLAARAFEAEKVAQTRETIRRAQELGPPIKPISSVAQQDHPRRGYRTEVRKWMNDEQLESIPDAAKRLQVGYDVLKSIMSNRGKKRYGDETLRDVLKKIGHTTP